MFAPKIVYNKKYADHPVLSWETQLGYRVRESKKGASFILFGKTSNQQAPSEADRKYKDEQDYAQENFLAILHYYIGKHDRSTNLSVSDMSSWVISSAGVSLIDNCIIGAVSYSFLQPDISGISTKNNDKRDKGYQLYYHPFWGLHQRTEIYCSLYSADVQDKLEGMNDPANMRIVTQIRPQVVTLPDGIRVIRTRLEVDVEPDPELPAEHPHIKPLSVMSSKLAEQKRFNFGEFTLSYKEPIRRRMVARNRQKIGNSFIADNDPAFLRVVNKFGFLIAELNKTTISLKTLREILFEKKLLTDSIEKIFKELNDKIKLLEDYVNNNLSMAYFDRQIELNTIQKFLELFEDFKINDQYDALFELIAEIIEKNNFDSSPSTRESILSVYTAHVSHETRHKVDDSWVDLKKPFKEMVIHCCYFDPDLDFGNGTCNRHRAFDLLVEAMEKDEEIATSQESTIVLQSMLLKVYNKDIQTQFRSIKNEFFNFGEALNLRAQKELWACYLSPNQQNEMRDFVKTKFQFDNDNLALDYLDELCLDNPEIFMHSNTFIDDAFREVWTAYCDSQTQFSHERNLISYYISEYRKFYLTWDDKKRFEKAQNLLNLIDYYIRKNGRADLLSSDLAEESELLLQKDHLYDIRIGILNELQFLTKVKPFLPLNPAIPIILTQPNENISLAPSPSWQYFKKNWWKMLIGLIILGGVVAAAIFALPLIPKLAFIATISETVKTIAIVGASFVGAIFNPFISWIRRKFINPSQEVFSVPTFQQVVAQIETEELEMAEVDAATFVLNHILQDGNRHQHKNLFLNKKLLAIICRHESCRLMILNLPSNIPYNEAHPLYHCISRVLIAEKYAIVPRLQLIDKWKAIIPAIEKDVFNDYLSKWDTIKESTPDELTTPVRILVHGIVANPQLEVYQALLSDLKFQQLVLCLPDCRRFLLVKIKSEQLAFIDDSHNHPFYKLLKACYETELAELIICYKPGLTVEGRNCKLEIDLRKKWGQPFDAVLKKDDEIMMSRNRQLTRMPISVALQHPESSGMASKLKAKEDSGVLPQVDARVASLNKQPV